MTERKDVLDHGYIRVVDSMGSDLSIVRAARVSYDAKWRDDAGAGDNKTGDAKLINYLMRNRHTSPFESVQFTFEVKCPMFVARQWMRHRTQSFSEVSARYTELPEEFYIPSVEQIGIQSLDNKQMRDIGKDPLTEEERDSLNLVRQNMKALNTTAFAYYRRMLDDGIPRELARTVLPLATYTRFFTSMNLHNLFHFLGLRLHEHAQFEIRVYAMSMLDLVEPIVPVATEAFVKTLR